jgi:hypothetical protein
MIIDPKNVDFSKYRRFFAFGCSFTNCAWPTWPSIIAREMPNAEFYNLGRSGAGNPYIATMYSQNNMKYNFDEHDLVMILWSTNFREDKYIKNTWVTPGNLSSQGFIDMKYVEKYIDIKGCIIRDLALMDLVRQCMINSKTDSIQLLSVPFEYDIDKENITDNIDDVLNLYQPLIDIFPRSFFENENYQWKSGHTYYHPAFDKGKSKNMNDPHTPNFSDYHPNTYAHYRYLKDIGFKLSSDSGQYALDTDRLYDTYTHVDQFLKHNLLREII